MDTKIHTAIRALCIDIGAARNRQFRITHIATHHTFSSKTNVVRSQPEKYINCLCTFGRELRNDFIWFNHHSCIHSKTEAAGTPNKWTVYVLFSNCIWIQSILLFLYHLWRVNKYVQSHIQVVQRVVVRTNCLFSTSPNYFIELRVMFTSGECTVIVERFLCYKTLWLHLVVARSTNDSELLIDGKQTWHQSIAFRSETHTHTHTFACDWRIIWLLTDWALNDSELCTWSTLTSNDAQVILTAVDDVLKLRWIFLVNDNLWIKIDEFR